MTAKRRTHLTPPQAAMVHRLVADMGWTMRIEMRLMTFNVSVRSAGGKTECCRIARQLIRHGLAEIVRDQLLPTLEANQFCLDNPQ